jgi:hypothetical protein
LNNDKETGGLLLKDGELESLLETVCERDTQLDGVNDVVSLALWLYDTVGDRDGLAPVKETTLEAEARATEIDSCAVRLAITVADIPEALAVCVKAADGDKVTVKEYVNCAVGTK